MQLSASCSESMMREGTSWNHAAPIPLCVLSHHSPAITPTSSISYSRSQLHNLPGQSVPFNHYPQSKKGFLEFKQNFMYFSLCLLLLIQPLPRIGMKLYAQVHWRHFHRSQQTATMKSWNFQRLILTSAFLRASMAFISIICCLLLSRSYWSR